MAFRIAATWAVVWAVLTMYWMVQAHRLPAVIEVQRNVLMANPEAEKMLRLSVYGLVAFTFGSSLVYVVFSGFELGYLAQLEILSRSF